MPGSVARYREYMPGPALRPFVRAFFTFTLSPGESPASGRLRQDVMFSAGDVFWTSLFADAHISIAFSFGDGYRIAGLWDGGSPGHAIGPMTRGRLSAPGKQLSQVGAYLHPRASSMFTGVPPAELRDCVVSLRELWGAAYDELESRIASARSEMQQVEFLESEFQSRARRAVDHRSPIDFAGVCEHINSNFGRVPIEVLAFAAGVSRQHFTREFSRIVGVPPKLYSRLARFRASLGQLQRRDMDWAGAAADFGYFDQSHMIAEFRTFCGRTPLAMVSQPGFHPFVGTAGHMTRSSVRLKTATERCVGV